MIQAFCDESGIHDGARACSVAGWVATTRTWQRFEERWSKACGGVEWHGKEFFARSRGKRVGPYAGWDDDKALAYIKRLVDAIVVSDPVAVGGVIDVRAFNALSLDDRKWLTGATWNNDKQRFTTSGKPSSPYHLGFTECLEGAAACVKKPGWQVSFVFDQQNVYAPWALEFFRAAKGQTQTEMARYLGDVTFKSKDGVAGLQAADLLANALYRVFTAPFTKVDIRAPEMIAITDPLNRFVKNRIASYNRPGLALRLRDRRRFIRQKS